MNILSHVEQKNLDFLNQIPKDRYFRKLCQKKSIFFRYLQSAYSQKLFYGSEMKKLIAIILFIFINGLMYLIVLSNSDTFIGLHSLMATGRKKIENTQAFYYCNGC